MRTNNLSAKRMVVLEGLIMIVIVFTIIILPGLAKAATVTHTYDVLNRLIQTIYTDGSNTTSIIYTYDAAGNITSTTTVAEGEFCEGDFDIDGDVDGSDLATFAANFGRTDCGVPTTCDGDFNDDGDVDGSDLATFAADFGRTDCPE